MKMKTPRPESPRAACTDADASRLPSQALLMRQRGATSIEYVLLAALIGLAAVIALTQTGSGLASGYENLQTKVQQA